MPPGWNIDFQDIEHELEIINRRSENSQYRLVKRKAGRFHDGQRNRLFPTSLSTSIQNPRPSTAATVAEAAAALQRQSITSTSRHRSSVRRRSSHHSRQSSAHSDTIRRAFQSIQKVPEALKHLRAFASKKDADASFEDRLNEFAASGDQVPDNAKEAAPEDLFRDLFGPAKPQTVSAPIQQTAAAPPVHVRPKPSNRLEASLDVFVVHGLLPRPEECPERFRSGYPSYNMRNMDATQRDLYAFAIGLDRVHKSQAKNVKRERSAAYRRAKKYHRELLERAAQDAKAKSRARAKT